MLQAPIWYSLLERVMVSTDLLWTTHLVNSFSLILTYVLTYAVTNGRCAFLRNVEFILLTKEMQCIGMKQQQNTSNPSNFPNPENHTAQGTHPTSLNILINL